jgi:hypothetical protein
VWHRISARIVIIAVTSCHIWTIIVIASVGAFRSWCLMCVCRKKVVANDIVIYPLYSMHVLTSLSIFFLLLYMLHF